MIESYKKVLETKLAATNDLNGKMNQIDKKKYQRGKKNLKVIFLEKS